MNLFSKKPKTVERWNMLVCTQTETDKIQEALNMGYEPYAVITKPVPTKPSKIEKPNQKQQAYTIVEMLYFKQKVTALLPEFTEKPAEEKIESKRK